jgi:hypothetical protein
MALASGSQFGKISPNFDLKNMISTYTMDFPWENGPNLTDFLRKKIQVHQIFMVSSSR